VPPQVPLRPAGQSRAEDPSPAAPNRVKAWRGSPFPDGDDRPPRPDHGGVTTLAAPPAVDRPTSVTVSVTRRAQPGREREMAAWLAAGSSLAESFPGFLGVGWVRPAPDASDWHVLYRFADESAVRAWEHSPQRQWWLASAQGLVEDTRTERRTGIEGWFDEPAQVDVRESARSAPPRWKQGVVIWLGFFPLSLLTAVALTPHLTALNVVLRTLVTTVCLTPVMTYLVLPRLTRALEWWLQGHPRPRRRSA
jgi:uncharacterized protein